MENPSLPLSLCTHVSLTHWFAFTVFLLLQGQWCLGTASPAPSHALPPTPSPWCLRLGVCWGSQPAPLSGGCRNPPRDTAAGQPTLLGPGAAPVLACPRLGASCGCAPKPPGSSLILCLLQNCSCSCYSLSACWVKQQADHEGECRRCITLQGRVHGCQSRPETPHEAGLLSRGACPCPSPGAVGHCRPMCLDTAQPALRRRKLSKCPGMLLLPVFHPASVELSPDKPSLQCLGGAALTAEPKHQPWRWAPGKLCLPHSPAESRSAMSMSFSHVLCENKAALLTR